MRKNHSENGCLLHVAVSSSSLARTPSPPAESSYFRLVTASILLPPAASSFHSTLSSNLLEAAAWLAGVQLQQFMLVGVESTVQHLASREKLMNQRLPRLNGNIRPKTITFYDTVRSPLKRQLHSNYSTSPYCTVRTTPNCVQKDPRDRLSAALLPIVNKESVTSHHHEPAEDS